MLQCKTVIPVCYKRAPACSFTNMYTSFWRITNWCLKGLQITPVTPTLAFAPHLRLKTNKHVYIKRVTANRNPSQGLSRPLVCYEFSHWATLWQIKGVRVVQLIQRASDMMQAHTPAKQTDIMQHNAHSHICWGRDLMIYLLAPN